MTTVPCIQSIASDAFEAVSDFIDPYGFVDYDCLMSGEGQLVLGKNKYFIANMNVETLSSPEEKLAFYCNAYNMAVLIAMVNELFKSKSYSLDSLIHKGKFFMWQKHDIAGQTLTLNSLENDIIRKFGDPRIHFYINCASKSCPRLPREILTAENMEKNLDENTKSFINEQGGAEFQKEKNILEISKIFKWYADDFASAGGVVSFIKKYHKDAAEIPDNIKTTTKDYEWCLNRKVSKK